MKTFVTFALIVSSMMMMSCTKENIVPTPQQVNTTPTPPSTGTNLVVMELYATYMGVADSISIPLATGQTMTGVRDTANGIGLYEFTGSSSDCNFSFELKDTNGGLILPGDVVGVTSAQYTLSNGTQTLTAPGAAQVTIVDGTVIIEYGACVVPLNGTSGHIRIEFVQQ